ncbi:ParB/RepB/Spo0J family partition protein, partial [Sphingomonas sp.]|uniref:ParB/RepB/Spo0J family partition protein n=1 Tax=Sphingomonas sp. TaxID=28214 RepID=UPI0031DD5286
FIPLDKLFVDKANMRFAKRPPDVSDILPTVRKRGIIQTLLVKPANDDGLYGIVAGSRRFHAARLVGEERRAAGEVDPDTLALPCGILEDGDDADAIEASLIENLGRLDPDEVTQWETFTRLVKEGRTIDDIALTFGLPELTVKRVLALGNLLPRIRATYAREEIDRVTVRHLTLASKSQQKAWLALADDPDACVPTGHQLKAWLFGGQSISTAQALFDVDASGLAVVADLFGEGGYFADADAFWIEQNAAIDARCAAYLDAGWADAVIVPPSEHFHSWEYEKAPKRKGGRVYIDVRGSGEVIFHEGYLTRKEARRIENGEAPSAPKPPRPEITSAMQTYIDLHRHAAVRAALVAHPGVALRLLVAHAITGSPLWQVRIEPQSARSDEVRESVEVSRGETVFDERRRAVLALLGFSPEEPTVIGGAIADADGPADTLAALFARLLALPDAAVMDVIAIVMGESLAAGTPAIEALGLHIGLDMADWWQPDAAFFELVRDRGVMGRIVAEVAGETVARANAGEKLKTLKRIVVDHLDGANGRPKVERWVPRWMAFPPAAYTPRGGVGTVQALALAQPDSAAPPDPEPPAAPAAAAAAPGTDANDARPVTAEPEQALAA